MKRAAWLGYIYGSAFLSAVFTTKIKSMTKQPRNIQGVAKNQTVG
jgi:hypothetical protein